MTPITLTGVPTMKRTLFAGASALAFALSTPSSPAAAQGIPVYDNAGFLRQGAQHIETIGRWTSQLRAMEQQYTQIYRTANSLAHTTSVQGLASDLGRLSNTVPGAGAVGDLARGVGGIAGAAAQARSITGGVTAGPGFSAAELDRRVRSVANFQSLALQQARSVEGRISGIRGLLAEIDAQPDVQASAALGNRIQAEGAFLAAQQQQLAQLQILQRAQEQADGLREQERARLSAEELGQATEWAWGALGR